MARIPNRKFSPAEVDRRTGFHSMRDDYLNQALKVVIDPNLLVNLVSRRVKQLRRGGRPLIESLEKLSLEDMALREIFEGKITWEVPDDDVPAGS